MNPARRRSASGARPSSDAGSQRRHRPDYQIILFTGILMMLGLVVMYAIGPQRANLLNMVHNTSFYTDTYFVVKQIVSLLFAIGAFAVVATVPFEKISQYGWRLMQASLVLCALLFIGGNILHIDQIAVNTLGAYRWFNLGPLGSFQPAELLKFSLLVYVGIFLGKRIKEGTINDRSTTVYPILGLVGAALFIVIVLQKDMGTGLSLAAIIGTMLYVSGMSRSILAKVMVAALVLGVIGVVTSPHRMERVATFFTSDAANDSMQVDDNGYHIKNAMIALGSGGFFGRGIGQSIQATGYLPEAINDSIFAIMGEIFGFLGTTLIVVLLVALLMRLLRIVDHLADARMRLVVAGVFGWLAAHVILNIASMIGIVPLTGITLPLVSFGGTSMIFMTGALGLAFQLSRYTSHGSLVTEEVGSENTRSRRGIGGSRYSRRRRYQ